MFKKFLDVVKEGDVREIILAAHGMLNSKHAYGSERGAAFARESIELVLEDNSLLESPDQLPLLIGHMRTKQGEERLESLLRGLPDPGR